MSPAFPPRLALAAVVLLAMLPLRDALRHPTTTLLGTSIDSVHHAWGVWYVARGTDLDTFWPVGAFGTVLGGPSLLVGALLVPWLSAAGAYLASSALQVALTLLGTACLVRRLGGGPWSAPAAALLVLCGRPLLVQVGWGVPEGAAVGWLAFALVFGLAPDKFRGIGVLTGALLGSSLVENPYTLPVVLLAAIGFTVARLRRREFMRLSGEAVGGVALLGVWALAAHGQEGSLATSAVGRSYDVLGTVYTAEGADGRAHPTGLLNSWTPLRYTGARISELLATGASDNLGWMPLLLAGWAALRRGPARWALIAAAGFVALALGSFPAQPASDLPGPFFFTNFVTGLLVRPLTQPVRYLVMASVGLAVAGGWLVGRWAAEGRYLPVALVFAGATAEALTVGSLATKIPTASIGHWSCLRDLDPGPVATYLEHPPFETSDAAALAAQLVHEQPGTHRAIGGWTARSERSPVLRQALAALGGARPVDPDVLRALAREGVQTVLVDSARVGGLTARQTCGGLVAIDVGAIPSRPEAVPR